MRWIVLLVFAAGCYTAPTVDPAPSTTTTEPQVTCQSLDCINP